jgi:hypothetical protein
MDELDMDNSMLSVASLPDFAAAALPSGNTGLVGSGSSDDTSAAEQLSLTSQAILDIVQPAAAAVEAFDKEEEDVTCHLLDGLNLVSGMSQALDAVDQPTLVEDVMTSLRTLAAPDSHTLVAPVDGGTYCVVPAGAGNNNNNCGDDTIADVTDIFDEESIVEPTLTAGASDAVDEIPELPRDSSQHATPAASGGESSVETTPLAARRKLSPKEKRQMDPDRYLTYTKKERPEESSETSGYKSEDTVPAAEVKASLGRRDSSSSSTSSSSRTQQRRQEDADRFRTRTISRDDIANIPGNFDIVGVAAAAQEAGVMTSPSASPRGSIRQRRSEESDRFRTHTITVGDLPPLSPSRIGAVNGVDMRISPAAGLRISAQEAAFLESEARLVVQTIKERKAEVRSRSTSADLLKEPDRSR